MWRVLLVWLAVAAAAAQERESRTYVYDANGRRVEWSATGAGRATSRRRSAI